MAVADTFEFLDPTLHLASAHANRRDVYRAAQTLALNSLTLYKDWAIVKFRKAI